jgi:hypothetical protein
MEDISKTMKEFKNQKDSSEIGIVTGLDPYFTFTINGQEYSSEFFTVYLPAVDRIRHFERIDVETYDPNPHETLRINHGEAYVDIGDLELEPDLYERRFLIGDLIDVTDRGDSFIVHGRLVKFGEEQELYTPTHRDRNDGVHENKQDPIHRPPTW